MGEVKAEGFGVPVGKSEAGFKGVGTGRRREVYGKGRVVGGEGSERKDGVL